MTSTQGKLFVVSSPIGNIEDITFRAIKTLHQVDAVFCESTTRARKLLAHYNIKKRLLAHNQDNETYSVGGAIKLLKDGKTIAYLSDAGTPGISDPGYLLINECISNTISVECLPGPTAFVPALLLSGFPLHEFLFIGFLPRKKGRKTKLLQLNSERRTIVLYESSHRLLKLLKEMNDCFQPNTPISVSKEITKMYETTVRGTIAETIRFFEGEEVRGEFVICINGHDFA